MHSVRIERRLKKKSKAFSRQARFMADHAIKTIDHWDVRLHGASTQSCTEGTRYSVELRFEKTKGKRTDDIVTRQWSQILNRLNSAANHSKFGTNPWNIVDEDSPVTPTPTPASPAMPAGAITNLPPGVQDIVVPSRVITRQEMLQKFPHELLQPNSDDLIADHPAFKGIYGRGPHIRNCLRSILSYLTADGERSNHILLHGLPGCAKSHMLSAVETLFGEGSVLRLNSDSTTKAGIEKLFFRQLTQIPPLVIIEEIEKTSEEALQVWLSTMDDRHEIRKVNFNMSQVRKVFILVLATANDKQKLDLMMGGRPGHAGPLSSRFIHQYNCPRPTPDEMRKILFRDIHQKGGKVEWVEPAMRLADEMGTDDPRKILGFLDGGDDLLNLSYQNDELNIYQKK